MVDHVYNANVSVLSLQVEEGRPGCENVTGHGAVSASLLVSSKVGSNQAVTARTNGGRGHYEPRETVPDGRCKGSYLSF